MNKTTATLISSVVAVSFWLGLVLPANAQNLAIVNGKAVPKERLTALQAQAIKSGRAMPVDQLKEEIIMREIFVQEAQKRGLEATPDYKDQMELMRQSVLIRALLSDYEKKNPISDNEVKAAYDKMAASAGGQEYKARHILVGSEAEATAIIASLKKGGNFEEIAKKQSKDSGSGANGGDLDWANPNNYVPEFSQALIKLSKGQTTESPVKTDYGYHVIRLDDIRPVQLPKLEEVKPQIVDQLKGQKFADFQKELRAKAKIQ